MVLGVYRVQPVVEGGRLLAAHRGGMGLVYRVRHLAWHVDLAVKVPRPELFRHEDEKERFEDEAENWVRLGLHPHVVPCHYVRRIGEAPCIFSDYVDGGSLANWLAEGRLYRDGALVALERILDVAIQTAWGLAHAHRQGFVHQDVKPANVLVEIDGRAQIADFGLAQARAAASGSEADASRGHTIVVPGMGAMTYLYASPEQLAAEPLTRATDVWSWAVSILELFCGRPVWDVGSAAPDVLSLRSKGHGPVPLPGGIADLLGRCLELDPDRRPDNLDDVAAELQELYVDLIGASYPRVKPERASFLADTWSNHALSLLDLGRDDEAEHAWAEALQADPQHPQATFNQGLYHWRACQLTTVDLVRRLEHVVDSHPQDWLDRYLLGRVHLERGEAKQARIALTSALLLAPDEPEIALALEDLNELLGAGGSGIPASWSYVRPANADALTGAARAVAAAKARALEASSSGRFADAGAALADARRIPGWHRQPDLLESWRALGRHARRRVLADAWAVGTLEGHVGSVNSITVTNERRRVMTVDGDSRTIRLWDLCADACVRTLGGGDRPVDAAVASRDGRICLSHGHELIVCVWDLETGTFIRALAGHTAPITAVALTPDGRHGLSAASDGTLRLWAVGSGICLRTLRVDEDIRALTLASDGRRAVTIGTALQAWNLATGVREQRYEWEGPPTNILALTSSGEIAVSGHADGSVRYWHVDNGSHMVARPAKGEAINAVAVSLDGRQALWGQHDGAVVFWDKSAGQPLRVFTNSTNPVSAVAISSDACLIVSGNDEGLIQLWELDWQYEFLDAADWYVGATPHAISFLRAHTPSLSDDLSKASWHEDEFADFLSDLEDMGYGWLRPEGIRAWLERVARR